MRAVAVFLDGVIRKAEDPHANDSSGRMLFASLVGNFRVVVLGTEDIERDEQFLLLQGLTQFVKIEPLGPGEPAIAKRNQINKLRAEGYNFEFVVVADPTLATYLYHEGIPVLVYLHPTFTAKSFRPDYAGGAGLRAWNELSAEVDYQLEVKAKKLKEQSTQ